MSRRMKRFAYGLLIGVVSALGCSKESATPTAATPANRAVPPAPVLKPDVPQTPEAAAKAVFDGLKAGKPIALWNALEDSQQAALNDIVRETASSIDPDVWKHSVRDLKKLVVLMETKKDFILASALLKADKRIKIDDVKARWPAVVKLLRTVADSELVDQEKMKNFDGRAFLEGAGAKVFADVRALTKGLKSDPFKSLDDLKLKVTETTPGKAKLELESAGAAPVHLTLSIRAGKWVCDQAALVPVAIRNYAQNVAVRFRPYALVEWKDDYLKQMARIETAIDKMQACKTSEEFQNVAFQQVFPIAMGLMSRLNQKPKTMSELQAKSEGRTKDTAMLVIKGEHFGDEPPLMSVTKALDVLAKERNGSRFGPMPVDKMTVLLVKPVDDVNDLVKVLHDGKITKVDAKRNCVNLELPGSESANEKGAASGTASAKSGN